MHCYICSIIFKKFNVCYVCRIVICEVTCHWRCKNWYREGKGTIFTTEFQLNTIFVLTLHWLSKHTLSFVFRVTWSTFPSCLNQSQNTLITWKIIPLSPVKSGIWLVTATLRSKSTLLVLSFLGNLISGIKHLREFCAALVRCLCATQPHTFY